MKKIKGVGNQRLTVQVWAIFSSSLCLSFIHCNWKGLNLLYNRFASQDFRTWSVFGFWHTIVELYDFCVTSFPSPVNTTQPFFWGNPIFPIAHQEACVGWPPPLAPGLGQSTRPGQSGHQVLLTTMIGSGFNTWLKVSQWATYLGESPLGWQIW